MLERTAAGCLESGSLRRLLPKSKKSLKSRRALHSTFWNHGAADIELSPLWAALMQGPENIDQPCDEQLKHSTDGSTVLLDFLYPAGTINFIRQYSGWGLEGRRKAGLKNFGNRLYTSSAQASAVDDNDNIEVLDNFHYELRMGTLAGQFDSKPQSQQGILALQKKGEYDQAWTEYELLGESDQKRLRRSVLAYFTPSQRIVDAERIVELFNELSRDEKDLENSAATIRSYLRLRKLGQAIDLFKETREIFNSMHGASEILAHMVRDRLWGKAIDMYNKLQHLKASTNDSYDLFQAVRRLPDLQQRAKELVQSVDVRLMNLATEKETVPNLVTFAVGVSREALLHGEIDRSIFLRLLIFSEKWMTLHDFEKLQNGSIRHLLDIKETAFAVRVYRTCREFEGARFWSTVLHDLLKVFCEHRMAKGMYQVLDDYVRFHGTPPDVAYGMVMAKFASMDEVDTVHALFDKYLASHRLVNKDVVPGEHVQNNRLRANQTKTLLHLHASIMNVHARRGDVSQVTKYFDDLQHKYGIQPNIVCWNILINAYGKADDIDSGFESFERLLKSPNIKPDTTTFGTMMGMSVAYGDLEMTTELYKLVDSMKVKKNTAMIDCLVQGHVQDEHLERAEKICEEALTMSLDGTRTRMWNYVLLEYATLRDLVNVNRVLERMSKANVPYDGYTYAALMQVLCMVKQPDRANAILKDVMPELNIKITNLHYAIVMGGYITNGEIHKVPWMQLAMQRHNREESATTKLIGVKTVYEHDRKRLSLGKITREEETQRALQIFMQTIHSLGFMELSGASLDGSHITSSDLAYPSMFFSYMISVLAHADQHETVDQLYQTITQTLPRIPPTQLLSALMISKLRRLDYKGIQECWDLCLSQERQKGKSLQPPAAANILPKRSTSKKTKMVTMRQLGLCRPLTTYMISLARQKKVDQLPDLISSLVEEGFRLNNKNWNHYTQIMARRYRFKIAFTTCEQKLMPGWTGWAHLRWESPVRNRLPLEVRYWRKGPKSLRPIYHTILYLARAYLELQEMAVESRSNQMLLHDLERDCPKTITAIRTMKRTGEPLEDMVLKGDGTFSDV